MAITIRKVNRLKKSSKTLVKNLRYGKYIISLTLKMLIRKKKTRNSDILITAISYSDRKFSHVISCYGNS